MATDTPSDILPSVKRAGAAATAEERPTLEAFLDMYRDLLVRKVTGLPEDDTRRQLVASDTTLAGLVRHLRIVEMEWFQRVLDRVPDHELPVAVAWDQPGSSFILEPGDITSDLILAYQEQCEVSRRIAGRYELDDVVPHVELGKMSLRWIYVHMIQETAQHLGHADILREQLDGITGH